MRKTQSIMLLLILVITCSSTTNAAKLRAEFTYSTFNSPTDGPYIETYLSVLGNSVIYKKYGDFYQGVIEITYVFKKGTEIKKYKKYNLLSPENKDSIGVMPNFIDQQRISLASGDYDFEITIRDTNALTLPFSSSRKITLNYNNTDISISDIELIESLKKTTKKSSLSKSGYDIYPYASDFYPETFEKIAFYAEIYNVDKKLSSGESFLINYSIQSAETRKTVGNYKSYKRSKAKAVNVILQSFPIEKLPSGNYHLTIEVRNKTNELLISKKIFFQRSNPQATPIVLTDAFQNSFVNDIPKEQLDDFISSVHPISNEIEISFAENQLKGKDEKLMRQYFYNFWASRNEENPKAEWEKYYELVKTVNKQFRTGIKKGYETDRGRTYLKYGKPNTRMEIKSEPSSYPYEIWHYYEAGGFSNIKFVFYSPDVITNDYPLLHSNMRGEIKNPQWKVQLHKRTNATRDMTEENSIEHWGSRAAEYYANPR